MEAALFAGNERALITISERGEIPGEMNIEQMGDARFVARCGILIALTSLGH
jgi:hypothetical protein